MSLNDPNAELKHCTPGQLEQSASMTRFPASISSAASKGECPQERNSQCHGQASSRSVGIQTQDRVSGPFVRSDRLAESLALGGSQTSAVP